LCYCNIFNLKKVNGGPTDIISLFLGNKEKFEFEKVLQLNQIAKDFLNVCKECINKCNDLYPNNIEFNKQIQEGYIKTEKSFFNFILKE
jgi:hypothetical protein